MSVPHCNCFNQACPNFSNRVPHIFGLSDMDNSLLSFLKGISNSADDISTTTIQQHDHVSTATTKGLKPKRVTTTPKPETETAKSDSEPELDLSFSSIKGLTNFSRSAAFSKGKTPDQHSFSILILPCINIKCNLIRIPDI